MARKNPNIIITGTPGVGKTTHAEQLARATGLKHVSVNQIVKDEGFHEGKDEETGSWIVDEDKVCPRSEHLFGRRKCWATEGKCAALPSRADSCVKYDVLAALTS